MNGFLSIDEVVERYKGKVTKGTLANWRSQKKNLPYTKIGGRVLCKIEDLEAWEQTNTRKHAA